MQNDLNFLNSYIEVVDENLSSVIKQNFVFQTQLKLAQTKISQLEAEKKRADDLLNQNKELQQKVNTLTNLYSGVSTLDADRGRLQVALNETSQTKNQLQSELNSAQQEIARLRNQINNLSGVEQKSPTQIFEKVQQNSATKDESQIAVTF
jgi:chromosome segregation ATPase